MQRGHRVPAAVRPAAGHRSRRGPAGSRRPQPPDLGTGRPGGRHRPAARADRGARRGDRRAHRAARVGAVRRRRGAVLLPALLLGARRGGRRGAGPPDPGRGGRGHRAGTPADVRRPGPGPQARAAVRAGRRVLLRGGGGPARLAGQRHRGHPGGQRPERGHVPVPGRRRGGRGARGDRGGRRPPGARGAAAAADARAGRARVRVRGTGRGRRAARRPGPGPRRAAGPSAGRPDRPGRRAGRPARRGEPGLPALGQCWPGGRPPGAPRESPARRDPPAAGPASPASVGP